MPLAQSQALPHVPGIEAGEGKGALIFGEVGRGLGARGEEEEYDEGDDEGEDAFDEEEDAPLGYAGMGEGGDAV
jgi:hypothetical protein